MNLLLILYLSYLSLCASKKNVELEEITLANVPAFDIKKDNFVLAGVFNKTWDGPVHYDALIGSMITLPCITSDIGLENILTERSRAIEQKKSWAILWVHQTWTNVIDPWLGDGRRSYDPLQTNQWLLPNMHTSIYQSHLSIVDIDPSDNGVYACVMVTYPIEHGYSPVYLKQAQLMSIHFVRIHSKLVTAPGCHEHEHGSNEGHCKSGYEPWTFNVYFPAGGWTGDILFQAPCNAELFLTALSMSGVDPTFWSVGWRFVPYGDVDDSKVVETGVDSNINWTHPVHICVDSSPVPCFSSTDLIDNVTELNSYDLSSAHIRASNYWRARWLALTGSKQQYSGTWQCWIQGLAITEHPVKTSFPIRWLTNEVHMKIVPRKHVYRWWTTIELWRVIALIMAPLNIVFIFIIFLIGWYSANRYKNQMKQKERSIGGKKKFLLSQHMTDTESTKQTPAVYLDRFLQKSGIRSYKEYAIRTKS